MKWKELTIDLAKPPEERWANLTEHATGLKALIAFFSGEIYTLVPAELKTALLGFAQSLLPKEHLDELKAIAKMEIVDFEDLLTANLYYDGLKMALGCSCFAFESDTGPVHARNLDWYSEENGLSKYSLITHYINGNNDYSTIGWPGFTGCLSGIAHGKFSITLNAVWSNDTPEFAIPVVYLIRTVLESAKDFDEAVAILSETPIASDCLLMVCGTNKGEMVVIERTPNRHALRWSENGRLFVTNDYKLIDRTETSAGNPLAATSCGRYNRMNALTIGIENTDEAIFNVLNDSDVKMEITMQQMYFIPRTGKYKLY